MNASTLLINSWFVLFILLPNAYICGTSKQQRMRKVKVEQHNGMIIVRQRSLEDGTAVQTPNQVSYDDIYSEWSPWSKCRKRCKQVRRRVCRKPQACQSNILKEERDCTGHRCWKTGNDANSTQESQNITQQLQQQQQQQQHHNHNSDRTKFRVLYHLQSYIYSSWSEWSACTVTCHTRRTRKCEMERFCQNNIIQEDALCYTPGSECEQKYKSQTEKVRDEEEQLLDQILDSGPNATKNNSLIDDANCGQAASVIASHSIMTPLLRIIGGRESYQGRWPWMVAVLNRHQEAFCGGTLVTPQFVITAAHCVRQRLYIRAGEHDLMFEEGTEQQLPVSEIFVHPEYDSNTVDNDIALLKLRRPLKLNKFVSPVCLPRPDDKMAVNSKGTILGWGKRKTDAMFGTDVLHEARVPIADSEDCKKVYENYYISENMVCAGYKRGKVDSCAGDSGGPLLFRNKDTNKWHLYGITSFGEGCGRKGRYGIYAKVPNLVQWIRNTIESNAAN